MRRNPQAGFTLVELIIATALGVLVMTALTSLVFTAYRADRQATARVEAAGEIRSFDQTAQRDFALSVLPPACAPQPCSDPIQLSGCAISSPDGKTYVWQSRQVTYSWNSATHVLTRSLNSVTLPSATDVTSFSWYIDGSAPNQSVVVTMAVTINWAASTPYTHAQTLRFYPRVVSQVPAYVDPACAS